MVFKQGGNKMERLRTVGEIKQIVEDKNEENKTLKKNELIKDMTEEIKGTLEKDYYLTCFPTENYLIEDIKEIANKMGCSIIKFEDKFYLCVEQIPNEEKIMGGFIYEYGEEMKLILMMPFLITILLGMMQIVPLFEATLAHKEFSISDSTWGVMIGLILFSCIPLLIKFIEMLMFSRKNLVCEDGIYIVRK